MPDTAGIIELKKISATLASRCKTLRFSGKVKAIYNPLDYAKRPHNKYLELAGANQKKVIFLGMNPGPWGMAQTGVPFGEIPAVRDWLGINEKVDKPTQEHPKRLIEGFNCERSEVSGKRLWGFFSDRYKTPKDFFKDHYVANYCPLIFMDENGANITPDKLIHGEKITLFEFCDRALEQTIILLKPKWVIGIGGFAKMRIDTVCDKMREENRDSFFKSIKTGQILHPSPANPRANKGWEEEVLKKLKDLGVWP